MNTEHFHEEDQLLKDLFQRSSTKPADDLSERILKEVSKPKEVFEYEPVISRKGWIMLASGFSALMIYLLSYDSKSTLNLFNREWLTNLTEWNFPSGMISLSLPELPFSFMLGLTALITFGIYFIVSYGRLNKIFGSKD